MKCDTTLKLPAFALPYWTTNGFGIIYPKSEKSKVDKWIKESKLKAAPANGK